MIQRMSSDRVTVSLPAEVRRAAQRVAQESGVPFSSVVADALSAWLRGRLVDAWLAEHEAEFGPFDEAELQELAAEVSVAYLPPASRRTVA
jgi:acyl-homoserine lactone acylase PvdQ